MGICKNKNMVNTSKYPSNPQETSQSGHPGVYFSRDSDRHRSYSTEYLFYYGKPSALPEYTADNDVANLQRGGDAGGADMPKFSGQTAACRASRSDRENCSPSTLSFQCPSAIAGHDMMQTLVPVIPNGFWFATPENEWQQLFWRYLPSWMTLNDLSVLQNFYDGEASFYATRYLAAWWGTGFMVERSFCPC